MVVVNAELETLLVKHEKRRTRARARREERERREDRIDGMMTGCSERMT